MRRRWWPVAVGCVLVVAATAGAGVWAFAGEPMKFTALASGGCAMVPSATVRSVVAEPHVSPSSNDVQDKGETIETACEWDSPDGPAGPFRQLSIAITVERDLPYAPDGDDPPKGLDRAKSDQRHDRDDVRDRAARPRVDGSGPTSFAHYPGRFTQLSDLGDEGFLTSEHVRKGDGSYDTQTAYAYARLGNALISVTYIAGGRPAEHVMTPAAEPMVRRGTETVARDVVRYLSHCKACTR